MAAQAGHWGKGVPTSGQDTSIRRSSDRTKTVPLTTRYFNVVSMDAPKPAPPAGGALPGLPGLPDPKAPAIRTAPELPPASESSESAPATAAEQPVDTPAAAPSAVAHRPSEPVIIAAGLTEPAKPEEEAPPEPRSELTDDIAYVKAKVVTRASQTHLSHEKRSHLNQIY